MQIKIWSKAGRPGDTWHFDEVSISIRGECHYLWCAIGQDSETLDILVQKHRDGKTAKRFFREQAFTAWLEGDVRPQYGVSISLLVVWESYWAAMNKLAAPFGQL
jgi:hypothetical protein